MSLVHVRADLAAELEQALLDDDRHFTGERQGLLALGEDADVPVMPVLGRGQLRARIRIGCRPLLDLPQLGVLSFDLCRPCLLPTLEVLDADPRRVKKLKIDRANDDGGADGREPPRRSTATALVPRALSDGPAMLAEPAAALIGPAADAAIEVPPAKVARGP